MLFIHAADLHLGCAEKAEARLARHRALEALVRLCLEKKPEALLLAGDIFDSPHPDRAEADFFFAQMARLSMPVLLVAGNHDPHLPGSIWDDPRVEKSGNLVLLGTEGEYVEFTGFRVYGASFCTHACSDSLMKLLHARKWEGINLLLLHGDVQSPHSLSNPLLLGDMAQDPYAYIALGHIHKTMEPRFAGDNLWSYAGTLAGHGFDETGPHGCMLVRCEPNRKAQAQFCKLTDSWFDAVDCDITGLADPTAVREKVVQQLYDTYAGNLHNMFLRIRLTGRIPTVLQAQIAQSNDLLADICAITEVEDQTRPLFDLDTLRQERTLRGAFVREMEKRKPFNEQALLLGLEAFEEQ